MTELVVQLGFQKKMSKRKSKIYNYKCGHDHGQGIPCDGHTLQLVWYNTSDTVGIEIDRNEVLVVDDNAFEMLAKAIEEYKDDG